MEGCHYFQSTQSVSYTPPPAKAQEIDANIVQLYQAFLERPLDDAYLSRELWTSTDQNVVDIERQALLEENGIRIGQMVGGIPAKLLTLLKSERSCVNARIRLVSAGESAIYTLGPVQPKSTFRVQKNGQTEQVALEDAQFCFDIVAGPAPDGRIKLEFIPKVQHRQQAFRIDVSKDFSDWVPPTDKPHRAFPHLSWHVSLAPGEVLVIGPHLDKPGTLGYRSFVQEEGPTPMQRVLILRGNRSVEEGEPRDPIVEAKLTGPTRIP